jgi:bifunctional DNA-binding transcriptional regulator/antitoxin component of YhaV-PrlF toxin-antitoxin module
MVAEQFKLKIAARRQITVPNRLLALLGLKEGDIIEITVEGNSFVGRGLRLVPTTLFTPEIESALRQREAEMNSGKSVEAKDVSDLMSRLSPQNTQ